MWRPGAALTPDCCRRRCSTLCPSTVEPSGGATNSMIRWGRLSWLSTRRTPSWASPRSARPATETRLARPASSTRSMSFPSTWGSGMGRALHDAALLTLAQRYREATLWVLDSNTRARAFYERNGWSGDGAIRADRRGDAILDEVRYRRDLLRAGTLG